MNAGAECEAAVISRTRLGLGDTRGMLRSALQEIISSEVSCIIKPCEISNALLR